MDRKNKKISQFLHNINYYKNVIPKKYLPYFDEITSLYTQRKIEKQSEVEKLVKKLASRGKGPASAIKLLTNKYRIATPSIGIKQNKIQLILNLNQK